MVYAEEPEGHMATYMETLYGNREMILRKNEEKNVVAAEFAYDQNSQKVKAEVEKKKKVLKNILGLDD